MGKEIKINLLLTQFLGKGSDLIVFSLCQALPRAGEECSGVLNSHKKVARAIHIQLGAEKKTPGYEVSEN